MIDLHSARFKFASRAALVHLCSCLIVAGISFVFVLGIWYPGHFKEMSAGRELFLLLTGVDVVLGPLLTLVLFTPTKSKKVLMQDLSLVIACQLAAFVYGIYTVYHARPLFLVGELDRFKTVSALDLRKQDYEQIPAQFKPRFFQGPQPVIAQRPTDPKEQLEVLNLSLSGGPDIGEMPKYYAQYDELAGLKMLERARALPIFLKQFPDQYVDALKLATDAGLDIDQMKFLPVVARGQWTAVLSPKGQLIGYLKGDGFKPPL